METEVRQGGGRPRVARFLNFLRGMETVPREPELEEGAPFLNFLRGMETVHVFPSQAQRSYFLNFLRGMETP